MSSEKLHLASIMYNEGNASVTGIIVCHSRECVSIFQRVIFLKIYSLLEYVNSPTCRVDSSTNLH